MLASKNDRCIYSEKKEEISRIVVLHLNTKSSLVHHQSHLSLYAELLGTERKCGTKMLC